MGKKNLEQLFKEKFEAFHEVPDESVWKSIEASLDKKKQKRRVVPIWWRLGGVAAVLAILFYTIDPFDDGQKKEQIIITETENNGDLPQKDNVVDGNQDLELPTDGNTDQDGAKSLNEKGKPNDGASGAHQSLESKTQLVDNGSTKRKKDAAQKETITSSIRNDRDNAVALVDDSSKENAQNDGAQKKTPEQILLEDKAEDKGIAQNSAEKQGQDKNSMSNVLEGQKEKNETIAENTQTEQKQIEKKSIFDAIAEQQEEPQVAEENNGKWSVGPSIAPVYFNATGDGSPIHSSFASNSKSGNVNLSYGLTVAYDIGKRLKIRSGVHKVNYGYDTNDVVFSSSLEASSNEMIDNISYSQTSRTLVVQSKNSVPGNSLNDNSVEVAANEAPALEGKMVQQLGYIEVPLELNYTLVDRKFGVDLIGGVSSFFLVENSILVESKDLVTEVGEANNANSINYSTNVGLGLNYEFSPKVQLNVEPVFKYHMNTFSSTAGSFKPFSVGVYSGISFKF
ncbi:MAG: hypothetical protein R2819_06070 [Allomuricauda sp.]